MDDLIPNRTGKVTEYKRGHIYLTVVNWEDGHCEIEVHRCIPELLFHSCDKTELDQAKSVFVERFKDEADGVLTMMDARRMLVAAING